MCVLRVITTHTTIQNITQRQMRHQPKYMETSLPLHCYYQSLHCQAVWSTTTKALSNLPIIINVAVRERQFAWFWDLSGKIAMKWWKESILCDWCKNRDILGIQIESNIIQLCAGTALVLCLFLLIICLLCHIKPNIWHCNGSRWI